jgi:hypothetical protein
VVVTSGFYGVICFLRDAKRRMSVHEMLGIMREVENVLDLEDMYNPGNGGLRSEGELGWNGVLRVVQVRELERNGRS